MTLLDSRTADRAATAPASSLQRALRAEVLRLRGTRAPWLLMVVSAALPLLATVTIANAVGTEGGPDVSTDEGVRTVLSAGFTAGLISMMLGIVAVTAEFRHRTAPASILLAGSRRRWALAKLLVVVPLGLVFTSLGQGAVLLSGLPVLSSKGVHPDAWSGDLLLATVGTCSLGALLAALGVGVGLLVRNQAAAVSGTVMYFLAVEVALLNYLPAVGKYLPGGAQAAITLDPTLEHLSMAAGYAVLAGWIALTVGSGLARLEREDVPH